MRIRSDVGDLPTNTGVFCTHRIGRRLSRTRAQDGYGASMRSRSARRPESCSVIERHPVSRSVQCPWLGELAPMIVLTGLCPGTAKVDTLLRGSP